VRLRCFGEVRQGYRSGLEMAHPEYRLGDAVSSLAVSDTLTPIYPTTKGISQLLLRKIALQVLAVLDRVAVPELLPKEILSHYQWPDLTTALRYLHAPPVDADVALLQSGMHPMQQRLSFEELLAHHLSLQKVRQRIQRYHAVGLRVVDSLASSLLKQLPFSLTAAQRRVWQEIQCDLEKTSPMLRLVQGDVGSGKTVIAALAVLQAVSLSQQAVVMAPTELLAEQHYRVFSSWCAPLGVKVGYLVSGLKSVEKKQTIEQIQSGAFSVVVGTHALFQSGVEFDSLALVVVDEQHRFGVHQRLSLMQKGATAERRPHQLIMTATPIPRTLSMMAYGDLDCSVIDELPPGRKPITTRVISQNQRLALMDKLLAHCQSGRQAYWVCTLIDESEALQAQAAEVAAQQLRSALPALQVGLVHGRMSSADKERMMQDFLNKKCDVLVATTVIEVGVDVPNASLMVIENPERLGLAQLHQLRGRVGRGTAASFCLLLYGTALTHSAKKRLEIMRSSQDGFYIAEQDLEMRGPGEVLGVRQSGLMDFKMADLLRDQSVLEEVVTWSASVTLTVDQQSQLLHRWLRSAERYAAV